MKIYILSFLFYLVVSFGFAQVGINTTNPSTAAVLHLEAQKVPTTNYGGFLMPVVTEAQQALIPVSTTDLSDDGLMVYVSDTSTGKQCWDIYDAVQQIWQSIHCLSVTCNADILYEEDFSTYLDGTGVTGVSATNGNYPSGVIKWTLTSFQAYGSNTPNLPGTLVDDEDWALTDSGELSFRDTNGVFRFETSAIDISGYADIQISMDVSETGGLEYVAANHITDFECGANENDFLDILYSTDGGSTFTELPNYMSNGNANHTFTGDFSGTVNVSFSGVSGTSLVIRVQLQTWGSGEYYQIDNILITCN